MAKIYVTDFAPDGVEHVVVQKNYVEEDIVEYGAVEKVLKIKGTEDFTTTVEIVEKSRINRNDYIQSFADQTGIDNILKRLAINNDPDALKALALKEGVDVDLSKLPDNYIDCLEFIKAKKEAYLKNYGDFGSVEKAATATNEDIDAYIARKVSEQLAAANNGGTANE